jgi:hypothetical protein
MATDKRPVEFVLGANDSAALAAFNRVHAKLEGLLAPLHRVQAAMAMPLNTAGLGRFTNQLGELRNAMQAVPIAGTLFAVGGVAAATKSLISNAAASAAALGNLKDLSDTYKISTESLQVYKEMGADVNLGIEELAKGVGFLQVKLANARGGDAEALQMLAGVGIDQSMLNKDIDSVMQKIMEAFESSTTDADDALKILFAKGILGKGGPAMIPFLEQGPKAFREAMMKMRAEGRLFADSVIGGADTVSDRWDAMLRRIGGVKTRVGLEMSPMLESVNKAVDGFLSGPAKETLIETFREMGAAIAKAAPEFVDNIPSIVKSLAKLFSGLNQFAKAVGWDKIVIGIGVMLASPFIVGAGRIAFAMLMASKAALVMGANLAIMAAGGLAAAATGTMAWFTALTAIGFGGASAIGLLLTPLLVVAGLGLLIYAHWDKLKALFLGFWEGFTEGMKPVGDMLEALWKGIKPVFDGIGEALGLIGNKTGSSEESLKAWGKAGKAAGEIVAGAFKVVLTPITAVADAIFSVVAGVQALRGVDYVLPNLTAKLWPGQVASGAGGVPAATVGGAAPAIAQPGGRQEVGGRVELVITNEGRALVQRLEATSGTEITARTGAMFGGGR